MYCWVFFSVRIGLPKCQNLNIMFNIDIAGAFLHVVLDCQVPDTIAAIHLVESIKTTSMEDVSTRVLKKIKNI